MISRCIISSNFLNQARKTLVQAPDKKVLTATKWYCKSSLLLQSSINSNSSTTIKNVLSAAPRNYSYQSVRDFTSNGRNGDDTDDMMTWSIKKGDLDLVGKRSKDMSNNEMIRILVRCIWPEGDTKEHKDIRQRVLLCFGLGLSGKIVNTSIPFILRYVVDGFNTWETIVPGVVIGTLACFGIARAIAHGCAELKHALFATVAQRIIRRTSHNVFSHLHKLDHDFHLNVQTGELSKTIDRGSRGISWCLTLMVFNVIPIAAEVALVCGVLAVSCGPEFAAVALVTVSSYAAFTVAFSQWRTQFKIGMNKSDKDALNKAVDSLLNHETVKYFNNEKYESNIYDNYLRKAEEAKVKTSQSLDIMNFVQNLILSTALSAIMMLAARDIMAGNITVGTMAMVNALLFQLSSPLHLLEDIHKEIRQPLRDMGILFKVMSVPPQISSSKSATKKTITRQTADITFDNVSFGYIDNHRVLNKLSFTVPVGARYAIVGASGSGKSTIARLIFRFYEPKSGHISIGGHDIKMLDLESVRNSISVVPQDCNLFHNSIRHNIAYGNLSATEESVREAAKMAGLHSKIINWPLGYDTEVGERGMKLSGGEKQRVAIARALLKNSPILIFDEATCKLDSITESYIMSTLNLATKGRTSIIIAQRLSTIVDCDKILVLDHGQVVEAGRHEDLVTDQGSLYYKMWESQHR